MKGLHKDITFAMGVYARRDQVAAQQAAAGIKRLLRVGKPGAVTTSSWSESRLTGDGFPLELAFSSTGNQLRYTADVLPAQTLPADRLGRARELLGAQMGSAIPDQVFASMRQLQNSSEVSYGAWVGARHRGSAVSYKLYSEINGPLDAGRASVLRGLGFRLPRRPQGRLTARMLGYTLNKDVSELYLGGSRLFVHELPRLLEPAGLSQRAGLLKDFLESLYGYSLKETLPGRQVGISYALCGDTRGQSVCLFFPARNFWGSDARCREQFLQRIQNSSTMREIYRALSAPLANQRGCLTRHGMLGIGIANEGDPVLSLGLRPVSAGTRDSTKQPGYERGEVYVH